MAFPRESTVAPVGIGDITIQLYDPDPTLPGSQSAVAHIQVRFNNGNVKVYHANLVDHLAAGIISDLRDLAALIRDKANSEILPE